MEELLEIQMFLHVQGTKEGDIPCGLSIEDTDLCVYEEGRR